LGKYGQEADKLVYTFKDKGGRQVALRYDQTVPTARLLVEKQNQLPRFFRRYQIQNVFRADKPQTGRYREFTQCDCDIFGSTSSLADAEIVAVYYAAFENIGLSSIKIEINDRQTLLNNLSSFTTKKVDVFSLIQSIDKLDKQTPKNVIQELVAKGLTKSAASSAIRSIENAKKSSNLIEIEQQIIGLGVPSDALVFNPKLARGLDYYTGLIFEGKIPQYSSGSVGGGGRYDQLIGQLSGLNMPSVGFGIGFDRTVEAADQLGLIKINPATAQIMVAIFNQDLTNQAVKTAKRLRQSGINTELYPNNTDRLSKQFKTANNKNIPYVLIIGQEEASLNQVTLKNMQSGDQKTISLDEVIKLLK
jgi:histidyl-tRNA synthetase